mgnify:CR=1 FL=1
MSDMIRKLGGYEAAREKLFFYQATGLHQLAQCLESELVEYRRAREDSNTDYVTDIRYHVSPACKVEEQ